MGFRIKRSLSILPGVRLNFSKSGTSLSIGGRGLTTNFSRRGKKTTFGLPGTGLSYSTSEPGDNPNKPVQHTKSRLSLWIWVAIIVIGFMILGR